MRTGRDVIPSRYLFSRPVPFGVVASRALDAEDFKTAIKRIRQRKEAEKRAREVAALKGASGVIVTVPMERPPEKKVARTDPIALQTP